jgi:hypothetical protein
MTPEELAASLEGANRKRRLRRRWASDASLEELAAEFGVVEPELLRMAEELGLGPREAECYLPSQEEIRLACSRLRAGWSDAERESRLSGRGGC